MLEAVDESLRKNDKKCCEFEEYFKRDGVVEDCKVLSGQCREWHSNVVCLGGGGKEVGCVLGMGEVYIG